MSKVVENIKKSASASEVREWAREQGVAVGKRGRLAPDVVKAYNAAHRIKHVEAAHVETVEVTAKPEKGRAITRRVNISQAREAAREAGVEVGARGRLPKSVLSAFVLGTLSDLASEQVEG